VAGVLALERPAPLFVNVGPGDAPFARGFRQWEREGAAWATIYRWALDGARVDFPFDVRGGTLTARVRVGRFVDPACDVRLFSGGRVVDSWQQEHAGWRVRSVALGELRGPLSFQFRSSDDADLGVALDWIEVTGAGLVVPWPSVLARAAALLLGVPLIVLLAHRRLLPAVACGVGLAALGTVAVLLDRLGGLMALAHAAEPALLVTLLIVGASIGLRRFWPEHATLTAQALPLAAVVVVLVALAHPGFYYPDVDTHARFVAAIRSDPSLAWDPSPFQLRLGTWTRQIGGERVAFPYSPVFHLLAWPFATLFGDVQAVKTLAALALAATLLLTYALARSLDLAPREAVLAQALVVALPVTASRLSLALYPTLLGQALDLLVVVCVARTYPRLVTSRAAAVAFAVLLLAQSAYTASLYNIGLVIGIFTLRQLLAGDRPQVLRLAAAYAAATALVLGIFYARFLPTLVTTVLPHATQASGEAGESQSILAVAVTRGRLFYDFLYPLLLIPGLLALRTAPAHARRLLASALVAGAILLLLRGALPALFRDAKEIELLAAPVAVAAAAGLALLARRGAIGIALAAVAGFSAAWWGLARALQIYGGMFVARGL
jgi:hypothetical protein